MFRLTTPDSQARQHTSASWTQITSSAPPPRESHASVVWENYIITFGGKLGFQYNDVQFFDLIDQTWFEPHSNTHPTLPFRYNHSICVDEKDNVIIFGGISQDVSVSTLNCFRIQKSESKQYKVSLLT